MSVLVGLESVDWVIAFSEDTPEDLIKIVKPDMLVKGGDYTPDQIAGSEFIKKSGGEVKIIPLYKDNSTSKIIKKINNN